MTTNTIKKNVMIPKKRDVKNVSFEEETKEDTNFINDKTPLGGDEFAEEDLGEGDQILAVKPWIGALKAMTPASFIKPNPKKAVRHQMELKWAHGFRSFDTKNNLRYNSDGHIIFTTAGVGIVQDQLTNPANQS